MKPLLAVLLAASLCAACAPPFPPMTVLVPRPPEKFEVLGPTEGTGCGSSWIIFLVFDARQEHAGYGSRFQRARDQALERVPGATSLVDVEISETTTWWVLGSTECITVRGRAIR